MEDTRIIKLFPEDISKILTEHFKLPKDSTVNYVVKESSVRCGYGDEGNVYKSVHKFEHIEIVDRNESK